jgi:hypothetical protein
MKWINGETKYSKKARLKEKIKKLQEWHKWFAWYPVKIGTTIDKKGRERHIKYWLCYVERRLWIYYNSCYERFYIQCRYYRTIGSTDEQELDTNTMSSSGGINQPCNGQQC